MNKMFNNLSDLTVSVTREVVEDEDSILITIDDGKIVYVEVMVVETLTFKGKIFESLIAYRLDRLKDMVEVVDNVKLKELKVNVVNKVNELTAHKKL